MKKATYKIRMTAGGIETRAGYITKICGYYFGVCKEGGFFKVSELYTGCKLTQAKTRAAAIENAENILKSRDAENTLNNTICAFLKRGGLLNTELINDTPEKLKTAFIALFSIDNISDLKRYSFRLSDYETAREIYHFLRQSKEAKTFIKPVADFFEACGLHVENVAGVYCITL